MFSLFLGLMFIGIGFGPTFGSIIVRATGTPISVFYVATAQHLVYAMLIALVVPESLSLRRMLEARRLHRESLDVARRTPKDHGLLASAKKLFNFLSPLALFFPKPTKADANPLKPSKHNWNLVLLAISYGCTISLMVRISSRQKWCGPLTLSGRDRTVINSNILLRHLVGRLNRSDWRLEIESVANSYIVRSATG